MEERKFDPYQFIGFVLIALILTWMLYVNKLEEGGTPEVELENTEVTNQKKKQAPPTVSYTHLTLPTNREV